MTRLVFNFNTLDRSLILPVFAQIADGRAENAGHKLTGALKSSFAIYSLKSASPFAFRQRSQAENLKQIYGVWSHS
ncbi:MAG: hypothetical protein WBA12_02145 [Catalinimonas sp.]